MLKFMSIGTIKCLNNLQLVKSGIWSGEEVMIRV